MNNLYIRIIIIIGVGISGMLSAYAYDIYPWPGYKNAQMERRVNDLEMQFIEQEISNHEWDLIQIERDLRKEEGNLIEAPPTLRKIYMDKKRKIQHLQQKHESLSVQG